MDVQSLSCNNCGAPLDVPANANYVTCTYCNARLAIKRNASTAYTEVLNQIGENTGQMADDLRFIRLKQQLQFLDDHWQEQNRQFLQNETALRTAIKSAQDSTRVSKSMPAMILGIVMFCGSGAVPHNPTGTLVLAGIGALFIIIASLGIWASLRHRRRYSGLVEQSQEVQSSHSESERAYELQRADILSQLDASSHSLSK